MLEDTEPASSLIFSRGFNILDLPKSMILTESLESGSLNNTFSDFKSLLIIAFGALPMSYMTFMAVTYCGKNLFHNVCNF